MKFALNHMVAPGLDVGRFFELARSLEIGAVEIRNDLQGNAIIDGTPAAEIRRMADEVGVQIASINALQRFNEWTDARRREAIALAVYARDCGAKALVLVPVNDGSGKADGERQENLRVALSALKPILEQHGIFGFVEPLGFQICSLRSKREAVEAIDAVGGGDVFRVVHDTFHHLLAGEPEIFASRTGLVHISGVADVDVDIDDMLDGHRMMVGEGDRIGNVAQIRALNQAGYAGLYSFEPFAAEVHDNHKPRQMIEDSIDFIRRQA
jgi:2-keto-myo-inositol isomerase